MGVLKLHTYSLKYRLERHCLKIFIMRLKTWERVISSPYRGSFSQKANVCKATFSVICLTFLSFYPIINHSPFVSGQFGLDSKLGTCTIIPDQYGRSSKTVLFLTAFVLPCIVIISCYARIYWVVHR